MSSKSVTAAPYLPDPNEVPASTVVTDSSCINRKSFPKGFVFGTGTSAYQHEGGATKGGRGQSTWDNFTLRNPGAIVDGSNGNVAVDMYSKYEEDIKMMKSMGFDAYRFSISWPRLLPGGRLCLGVNKEGIDFYNKIIDTLIANDLVPYVTLFHWDLPQSLEQEYGGFLSKNIVSDFREFAELCFWAFGDRVKTWITLNEPWTYCVNGYVNYTFAPSKGLHEDDLKSLGLNLNSSTIKPGKNHIPHRTVGDLKLIMKRDQTNCSNGRNPAKDPYTVARNLLLAHAAAVQTYRDNFQQHQKGNIGITLVCHWFEPKTTTCKEDKAAAKRALDFMIGWFLEPVLAGKWPDNMINLIPPGNIVPFSCDESNLLKGSIDFLGLNYYTAMYAFNDPCPTAKIGYYKDQQVAFTTERDGKYIGPVAGSPWLYIVPWGIFSLLSYLEDTYKTFTYMLPSIYITENGVDEKSDHRLTAYEACRDKTRVNYHRDHLNYILKSIGCGVDVKGYFVWSWCDNFEWVEGYTVRFGLIFVDYMNYLTRHPKDSALWFSKFLIKN